MNTADFEAELKKWEDAHQSGDPWEKVPRRALLALVSLGIQVERERLKKVFADGVDKLPKFIQRHAKEHLGAVFALIDGETVISKEEKKP